MPDTRRYGPKPSWPHELSDLAVKQYGRICRSQGKASLWHAQAKQQLPRHSFEQELANHNKLRQALPRPPPYPAQPALANDPPPEGKGKQANTATLSMLR